jgi:hypothetical protein
MPSKNPLYADKVVLANGGSITKADGTAIVSVSSAGVVTSTPGYGKTTNITLTGTRTMTVAESGAVVFFGSATEFAITLPAVSTATGVKYRFICTAAPSSASYTIVTASSENKIAGLQVNKAGTAGSYIADADTITFTDGQATAGDMVELYSDGTTWFAYSICNSATGVVYTKAS